MDDAARDVVVAVAGVARKLPIIGGQPVVMETLLAVNALGTCYTIRAAGPHISHERGYALATASLAGTIHLPLVGAFPRARPRSRPSTTPCALR